MIYIHYFKSISPSILAEFTVLFPFYPLLLLPSAPEVGFLIPQEWEHSVGRQSGIYLCAALVVAGSGWLLRCLLLFIPLVREWKSISSVSDSQVMVFSDTNSLRSLSFHAGKWANTFQVATTVQALLMMGNTNAVIYRTDVCFNIVTGH